MKLDIFTIAFITSIIYVTQSIAIFVQYKVNKAYDGVGWWLLGSISQALGFILMLAVNIKEIWMVSIIANPLVFLGQIFLCIGVSKFLDMKENRWGGSSLFVVFLIFYYYFMFANNSISSRALVISAGGAIITMRIAYKIFFKKDSIISSSANFTAGVFFAYACFNIIRFFMTVIAPPIQSYAELEMKIIHVFAFIVPIITSTLWTSGFIIMINQRLNAENKEEKEKMQMIFNTSPDAKLITRVSDSVFIEVNEGFVAMSGYTRDEILGKSTVDVSIWYKEEDRQGFLAELSKKELVENKEFIFRMKDGNQFDGMISSKIITIHDVPHIISVVHDISEHKKAEEAIRESQGLYQSMLSASPDDITISDINGNLLIVSPSGKKMFGYDLDFDENVGLNILNFIVPEDRDRAKANIASMLNGEPHGTNEYLGIKKDGSTFNIEVNNSELVQGKNGKAAKIVHIIRDITDRKLAEQKITELVHQLEVERNTAQFNAVTDSLTGIANRRYFDEALRTEFFRLKRSGAPLSLIILDIDWFKKFNDTYGHLAGDNCLRQVGAVLKDVVCRVPDIVARYGGEEFIVILPETEEAGAGILAEKIRKAIEEMAIPHSASKTKNCITISLGVTTVYTTELTEPEEIIALADEALYLAKNSGRNRVEIARKRVPVDKKY